MQSHASDDDDVCSGDGLVVVIDPCRVLQIGLGYINLTTWQARYKFIPVAG